MRNLLKDKKGDGADLLQGPITFIIINILIFSTFFFYVGWAGKRTSITEQTYAKQIALLIDQAKPGTVIEIDIFWLNEIAKKENYKDRVVIFNYKENTVTVKVAKGKGYSFKYFTEIKDGNVEFDDKNDIVRIKV